LEGLIRMPFATLVGADNCLDGVIFEENSDNNFKYRNDKTLDAKISTLMS
jgi:hypothetical protein